MLALTVLPAQASGGLPGYVVLAESDGSRTPLEIRARQTFNQLAPQLIRARQRGEILSFAPEFEAGILKVLFPAGRRGTALAGSTPVYSSLRQAIARVGLNPGQRLEQASLGVDPAMQYAIKFILAVNSSCFSMGNLGNSTRVVGTLRDKAGQVISAFENTASSAGDLYDCFDSSGAFNGLLPGFKVTFKLYNPSGSLLQTYTNIVPNVNFTNYNNNSALISGMAPASKYFYIYWHHLRLDDENTYISSGLNGLTSASGQWSVDFGSLQFRGGDTFKISVEASKNFVYQKTFIDPYITCELGGNDCGMYGIPGKPVSMTITHAGSQYSFSGKFGRSGWFGASVLNAEDMPVFLEPGDVITGTGAASLTLPRISANINTNTSVMSGKAPANKYLWVGIKPVDSSYVPWDWVGTNGQGNYRMDFSSVLTLDPNNAYIGVLQYTHPVTGSVTVFYPAFGP